MQSQAIVAAQLYGGEGVEQEPLKALVWFKRTADHGHALA